MPKSRQRPKKKAKVKDRHAPFAEAARRVGADMGEESFRRALSQIAKEKPQPKGGA